MNIAVLMLKHYTCSIVIFNMCDIKVIGITGCAMHGKDTLAKVLIDKYGYKRISFADPLKNGLQKIFGFTYEQLHGKEKEAIDEYWQQTPRKIMQFVGTDLFRNQLPEIMPHLGTNVWVAVCKKAMLDEWKINPEQKFVITDVRFDNEVNFIKEMNGLIVRVTRPNIISGLNCQSSIHASEIAISKFVVDHDIVNDTTVEELHDKFELILSLYQIVPTYIKVET
jgi:hypothetical protein